MADGMGIRATEEGEIISTGKLILLSKHFLGDRTISQEPTLSDDSGIPPPSALPPTFTTGTSLLSPSLKAIGLEGRCTVGQSQKSGQLLISQLWTDPVPQAETDLGPWPQITPDPVADCYRLRFPTPLVSGGPSSHVGGLPHAVWHSAETGSWAWLGVNAAASCSTYRRRGCPAIT